MDSVANIYESTEGWMPAARSTTAEMVVSRQAQEVQASIVIAKDFREMKWKASTGSSVPARERLWQNRRCTNTRVEVQK